MGFSAFNFINIANKINKIPKILKTPNSSPVKNPYITEMFSIMDVEATSDLSYAKVYISVFSTDEEKKKRTFDEIASSAKSIRYELARMMKSRTVPELKFYLDGTMDYSAKMEKLFKEIRNDD